MCDINKFQKRKETKTMAKNYTMGQAARIFYEGTSNVEMADIMRRFPYASMLLMKLNEEAVIAMETLPEFETVRKLDKLRRKALGILKSSGDDEDDDATDEDEAEVEAPKKSKEKPAKKGKKKDEPEDDEEDEDDEEEEAPKKSKAKKSAKKSKKEEDDDEDEDEDDEDEKPAKKSKGKKSKKADDDDDFDFDD